MYGKTRFVVERDRYRVRYDLSRCIACGACVRICPVCCLKNPNPDARCAKTLAGKKCTDCCRCVSACPVGAIRVGGNG